MFVRCHLSLVSYNNLIAIMKEISVQYGAQPTASLLSGGRLQLEDAHVLREDRNLVVCLNQILRVEDFICSLSSALPLLLAH